MVNTHEHAGRVTIVAGSPDQTSDQIRSPCDRRRNRRCNLESVGVPRRHAVRPLPAQPDRPAEWLVVIGPVQRRLPAGGADKDTDAHGNREHNERAVLRVIGKPRDRPTAEP